MTNTTPTRIPVMGNRNEQNVRLETSFSTITNVYMSFGYGKKDERLNNVQVIPGKIKEDQLKLFHRYNQMLQFKNR